MSGTSVVHLMFSAALAMMLICWAISDKQRRH
jgi:hypothetical protein